MNVKERTVRWVMAIDLGKCVGCGSCSIICDQANRLSFNRWRKVFDCGTSEEPERRRLCMPVSCMHCERPPCEEVCPTGATYRREDGIVDIRHERCIGCGCCMAACPYLVRSIVFQNEYDLEDGISPDGDSRRAEDGRLGTCTKCDFCRTRIDRGLSLGLTPGVDPDATPLCVITCTAGAIAFGNVADPANGICRLLREHRSSRLQEALGTDPSVYYLVD